ncbi:hypothetical protein [Haloferula sargassicola]|uniref:DUF2607 family protein n=1 Tax=Haloferula sargassicola TaxID=490096 RepID=A0ABP9UJJ6_9BACT
MAAFTMPPGSRHSLIRPLLAILLILQLGIIQLMAVSPALHEEWHGHCSHKHEGGRDFPCAVDLWLATGGEELPAPVVVPRMAESPPPLNPVIRACTVAILSAAHLEGGITAHAPPRAP